MLICTSVLFVLCVFEAESGMSDISSRLSELENIVKSQTSRIVQLEENVETLRHNNTQLGEIIEGQKEQLKILERRGDQQRSDQQDNVVKELTRDCNSFGAFELVANNQIQGVVFPEAVSGCDYTGSSTVSVVELAQGDVTFVRTSPTYTPVGTMVSNGNMGTSFAGWRIGDRM
ncbi:Hypothetical predicted protein [Mytilus galloprovincialis]|uniref:C1q domain containing protein n=1 Tax=Mytilus galloprovincialis TaxID=29158 RepID=A0A8B6GHB8_MYTGA|nr:Hypothetical predicted protein [Mytilus galloprovincialis]